MSLSHEVIELLREGKKIEAIKLYRERAGVGLKEAKEAVDALAAGRPVPEIRPSESPVGSENVQALVRQGRKIEAIKVYRNQTGVGLKEAKDAVEALMAGHSGPAAPGAQVVDPSFLPAASPDVIALVRSKKKRQAINLYRDQSGTSLAEARSVIDMLLRDHKQGKL